MSIKSIKSIILKKGWAGKTISRAETVERVNALIRPLVEILHTYNALLEGADESDASVVQNTMPTLRADIGKLAETVHSCGGTAYSGVELTAKSFADLNPTWNDLANREKNYLNALKMEKDIEHQMRTRAIIDVIAANASIRLQLINNR